MRRKSCFDRIESVARCHRTVLKTVDVLIRLARNDPKLLQVNQLHLDSLRALSGELHDVYFARMFACFESDLRHYWRAMGRVTRPPTEHLISSIGTQRKIPQTVIDAVQRIREFRNHLIHEQHEIARPITIDEAIRRLNAYLSRLPLEW